MRRTGSVVLASVAVIAVVCVFWNTDNNNSAVRESVALPGGSLKDSMYAQQTALFEELVQSDATVPESTENNNLGWSAERQAVWAQDSSMLAESDKAMYAALKGSLNDESSPHWEKYLRHKQLRPPAKRGHSWSTGTAEVTGLIEENTISSDSDRLCETSSAQHYGYFKLSGGKDKNYFYWLFEAQNAPPASEPAPLILWLTGGPGCSSELALFTENGPCKINKAGTGTTLNAYSWNRKAHIVFVDQPAGTGFSYGAGSQDIDHKESDISTDLYHFMQELVKTYPQYHNSPFYVFGESYAGHFVPATGDAISQGNLKHDSEYIALKGVAVGNGLTDPEIQYAYYPQMAFHPQQDPGNPAIKPVIDKATYDKMVASIPGCVDLIKECKTNNGACTQAFVECNAALIDPVQMTGINQYDIREQCKHPPLCGDYSNVNRFLNSPKVQKTLGVKKHWETCNFGVNGMFHVDWMHSQVHHVVSMLGNGVRVQLYAGDVDFICNWMGNKAWALSMDWPGKAAFNAAKDQAWVVNGKQVGRERRSGLLSFVQIHEAGHMVPQDQPAVAMLMTEAFTAGKVLVED